VTKEKQTKKEKQNYIKKCSKGNDIYTIEKLKSLNWLKKDTSVDEIGKDNGFINEKFKVR